MKVLITGANSYIGTRFEEWVSKYDEYEVSTLDLLNSKWKSYDFSSFHTVLHVAAIVHKKEKKEDEPLYSKVNTELPYEVAKKAKEEGVRQFIFMSSIAVYGLEGSLYSICKIGQNTVVNPKTIYGKSKLEAEEKLQRLSNNKFNLVIIRAPMVYGSGCKGNYNFLHRIACKTNIFPKINNMRSVLYIDNLCEFIRLIIDAEESGIFFPQDKTFFNTTETIISIGKCNKKYIRVSALLGFIVSLIGVIKISRLNKAFGSLVIEKTLSDTFEWKYCVAYRSNAIKVIENDIKKKYRL
ncbi:MAG: NAD-dependent epimerase/dehydratase family protein [Actinomycetia bacterium]|nr:NAD-dependent epimerase/dehydratase family protein [Actinomycetes bacterium]